MATTDLIITLNIKGDRVMHALIRLAPYIQHLDRCGHDPCTCGADEAITELSDALIERFKK